MKPNINKIDFPKWPQCVINGDKITPEQALEIIRRTDYFFSFRMAGGNDEIFNEAAREIIKMPPYDKDKSWWENQEPLSKWLDKWGFINLDFLYNRWVSSSWVGGPNGWCRPDGSIHFQHNIGKYPHPEDVQNELRKIAEAFPFLKFDCTIMDDEESAENNKPIITWHVENGIVEVVDTFFKDQLELWESEDYMELMKTHWSTGHKETYFDLSQIRKWANQVYYEER